MCWSHLRIFWIVKPKYFDDFIFLRYDYVIYSIIGLGSFFSYIKDIAFIRMEVHQPILLPSTSSLQVRLEKLSIMYTFNFSVYDAVSSAKSLNVLC